MYVSTFDTPQFSPVAGPYFVNGNFSPNCFYYTCTSYSRSLTIPCANFPVPSGANPGVSDVRSGRASSVDQAVLTHRGLASGSMCRMFIRLDVPVK